MFFAYFHKFPQSPQFQLHCSIYRCSHMRRVISMRLYNCVCVAFSLSLCFNKYTLECICLFVQRLCLIKLFSGPLNLETAKAKGKWRMSYDVSVVVVPIVDSVGLPVRPFDRMLTESSRANSMQHISQPLLWNVQIRLVAILIPSVCCESPLVWMNV